MKYNYFTPFLILASATLSLAQFGNVSISQNCQTTLLGLLGNSSVNSCFPFASVAPLVTTGQIPDQTALASAADAICADPKCSNDIVTNTLTTVQSGCKADLTANIPIVDLVTFVLAFYSPTRDSICFKNSTGGYCFIETESAVQQLIQNSSANQNPVLIFAGAPQSTVCTPCNKAIVNSYVNYINATPNVFSETSLISSQNVTTVKGAISGKCGASFIDGNIGNSTENPATFQSQNNSKKSDATSLIANCMSLVIVVIGSILATL